MNIQEIQDKMEIKRVADLRANCISNIKEALALIEAQIESGEGSSEMQLRRIENSANTIRNLARN